MRMDEVSQIIAFMAEAYPGTFKIGNKQVAIKLWFRALEDIPYEMAETAAYDIYMNSESAFPPRPKDIRDKCLEFVKPEIMEITAADAWGEVQAAISKYGHMMYDGPERYEEMINTLSPISQKMVKYLGWKELCSSTEPKGVIRGQFDRMFNQIIQRERTDIRRPLSLENEIKYLGEKYSIKDKKIEGPKHEAQLLKIK